MSPDIHNASPVIVFVCGPERRQIALDKTPFTIGRRPEKDLTIADARVSRDQAVITAEQGAYWIEDQGSKIGTFINGQRLTAKRKLNPDDRVEFGQDIAYLVFAPRAASMAARSGSIFMSAAAEGTELQALALALEAARKISTAGVLDEILVALVEATLRLTNAERGYVFLVEKDGSVRLAAGRDHHGRVLDDDSAISRSTLRKAVTSGSEFVFGDTAAAEELAGQMSIMAHDLRTVICIPLKQSHSQPGEARKVIGVLYLDSKLVSRGLTAVSHDLLRSIAGQAAALVENAQLAEAEEAARRYEQELAISNRIQQRLMNVNIPSVPYAAVMARNIPCKDIGGDFFDVVATDNCITAVVTDVCGKGVSAALMASILQGMVYAQLAAELPLDQVVSTANRFLCQKDLGEKYATMLIVRLHADGKLELMNCGHVPPCLIRGGAITRTEPCNFAVGMLPDVPFEIQRFELGPGDRLIAVTDGVTEAQDDKGEFFGDERLEQTAAQCRSCEGLFTALDDFRRGTPFNDDCTVLELTYQAR